MRLPCKQAYAGALPADSTNFNCGENEIQASLINSAFAGATPAPATNFWEVFRLPACKTGVKKSVGSDDWSITSTSHQSSIAGLWLGEPFWIRSSISRATRCLREGLGCKPLRIRHFHGV